MKLDKPGGYENKLMQSSSTGLHKLKTFKNGRINYIGPNDERSFFFWDVSISYYLSIMRLVADKTVKIQVKYI